jgi:hypothetical protein
MNFIQGRFTDVVFKGFYSTASTSSTDSQQEGGGAGAAQGEGMGVPSGSSDEEMKEDYEAEGLLLIQQ